jgi:capsular polysaccharide biosynthesis protein
MDLYEFTEILRRQKVLFISGILLLVSLIAFLSLEYDGGFRLRFESRYESSIRMAVVPASFDSLGNTLPNVAAMAGTTSLYATLLNLPETADEISTESGTQLLNVLEVTTSGRDGFIGVTATAADKEDAIDAALYSFTWLENQISAPPSIV